MLFNINLILILSGVGVRFEPADALLLALYGSVFLSDPWWCSEIPYVVPGIGTHSWGNARASHTVLSL